MGKYVLSRKADLDLSNIYRFGLQKFGEAQADRYFFGLGQQFQLIAESPMLFPKALYIHPDAHKCVYIADTIYYRIQEDHVEIMTIVGRQGIK